MCALLTFQIKLKLQYTAFPIFKLYSTEFGLPFMFKLFCFNIFLLFLFYLESITISVKDNNLVTAAVFHPMLILLVYVSIILYLILYFQQDIFHICIFVLYMLRQIYIYKVILYIRLASGWLVFKCEHLKHKPCGLLQYLRENPSVLKRGLYSCL